MTRLHMLCEPTEKERRGVQAFKRPCFEISSACTTPHDMEAAVHARLNDAWDGVCAALGEAAPKLRALVQQASAMAGPTAERLLQQGVQRGQHLLLHLRTADGETLAVYSAAAGMAILYLNSRFRSPPPARRRLFLGANAINSAQDTAARALEEQGLGSGHQVLIAARSMEAVEMWQFCSLLRADPFLIDGDQGSAVAFALRVRPHWFVYDSDVIAIETVQGIAKALKDNGCACVMLAVAEKAAPTHVMYNSVLGSARPGSRSSPKVQQKNVSPAFVPLVPSRLGESSSFKLFSDSVESNLDSRQRGAANTKPYAPDPLYATSYPASSSQQKHTTSAGMDANTSRDSDIFTEFGSAVVGLFGGKTAPAAQPPKSSQSVSLQRALDSQLNAEVGNRSSTRSDGQPLIAL